MLPWLGRARLLERLAYALRRWDRREPGHLPEVRAALERLL